MVVNKVDRDHADPPAVHDNTLELFLELNASESQFEAPFLYGSAKEGYFVADLNDQRDGVRPLLETIVDRISGPQIDVDSPFKMLGKCLIKRNFASTFRTVSNFDFLASSL